MLLQKPKVKQRKNKRKLLKLQILSIKVKKHENDTAYLNEKYISV